MKLGLVSSAYPPDLDGIGDYTWWLARTLAKRQDVELPVVVFTRVGSDHRASPDVAISRFFDPAYPKTFCQLLASLEDTYGKPDQRPDWLVLQYNPFSWGRRGYCPWVPSTLRRLQQKGALPRLAVMFHETTTPKWPWRFSLMFAWQNPIFRKICRLAEVAFVSTTRWIPQVRRAAPALPVRHLPVGSNIARCDVSRDEARAELGIPLAAMVLGMFGGAHISRRLDWIAATLAEARRRNLDRTIRLLYVGSEGGAVRRALGEVNMIDCGPLPADQVGRRLRAMDAAISPFQDGISTRRGSAIALLQHGIPLATNKVSWTDELFNEATPSGLLVSPATSAEQFAKEVVEWLGRFVPGRVPDSAVIHFHDEHLKWENIAGTMLKHLTAA